MNNFFTRLPSIDLSQVSFAFFWKQRGELDLYTSDRIYTICGSQVDALLQSLNLRHIPVEVMA